MGRMVLCCKMEKKSCAWSIFFGRSVRRDAGWDDVAKASRG